MESDRLKEILDHKRTEIEAILPKADLLRAAALERNDFRSLEGALTADPGFLSVISEVKKASPSAGTIAKNFDPVAIAREYEANGASAISVLTDEKFFGGKLSDLTNVRSQVDIPCLRKDFILHEAQIFEASVAGADAVLLIVAALSQDELEHLLGVAETFQLEALVEVHNLEEMERALDTDARIIGVNNRNLKTFTVDLQTTEELAEEVGDEIILVSESGIQNPEHTNAIASWGCNAVLVGETLMRSTDIEYTMDFLRAPRRVREDEEA